MTELEQAIVTTFKGNAALVAAASGGIHNVEAENNTTYPRIVFNLFGDKSNTFSHVKEKYVVDFNISTKVRSSASLNNLWTLFTDLFDDLLYTMTNYDTVSNRRMVSRKTKDPTDEKVWNYLVSYKVELEKK